MRWHGNTAWTVMLMLFAAFCSLVLSSQMRTESRAVRELSASPEPTSTIPRETQRRVQWPGNKVVVPAADQSFLTRPAAFGPSSVDKDGLWGTLIPIQTFLYNKSRADRRNTGCPDEAQALWSQKDGTASFLKQVWTYMAVRKRPPSDWIALVERGHCSFEQKVRTAQRMGALAVIVGDTEEEEPQDDFMNLREWEGDMESATRPITMYPEGDAQDIDIPSCFVIRTSYLDLMEYVDQAEQGHLPNSSDGVHVGLFLDINVSDSPWLDLGLAFFLLPSLMALCAVISHHVRALVKRYRSRASVLAVRSLPCFEWHPDNTWVPIKPEDVPGLPPPDLILRCMQALDALYARVVHLFSRGHEDRDILITHMQQAQYDTFSLDPQSVQPRQRWYLQDECPICLLDFAEGCVASDN